MSLEFRAERFEEMERMVFRDGRVVWFWREIDTDDGKKGVVWFNRFSVAATGREGRVGVLERAIVTYLGEDNGSGSWSCSKCSGKCAHTKSAQVFFHSVMGTEGADEEQDDIDDSICMLEDLSLGQSTTNTSETAISYLAILPPAWASLPTDLLHYPRVRGGEEIPERITLGPHNRSQCGKEGTLIDKLCTVVKSCTIFTTTGELTREIELLACPICPARKRCFIGPDPRNLGVFNYNNSVLFTHELLDEYTSRYTTSETPFSAFVEAMGRLYKGRGQRFVKEDLLRCVWFAYVNLQDLTNDMRCNKCGDEPDCLIWDGVTLGFGRKHILDTLRPPTHIHAEATDRYRRYAKKPQLILETKEAPVRRLMKKWITGKKRKAKPPGSDDEDPEDKEPDIREFNTVVSRLMVVSEEVGVLFRRTMRANGDLDPRVKRCYGRLFEQIAAEESAVQMVTPRCLGKLKNFSENPRWESASDLLEIPALYHVLEAESRTQGRYPQDLIQLCAWLYRRTNEVFSDLVRFTNDEPPKATSEFHEEPFSDNWKQLRVRPQYTKLKGDGTTESTKDPERGGKCAKYYATYGDKRLTGGIMAAWCTHSICYGFHCIPKGEGRNDVFSAMVTRWRKAPRRVVYDFACALAPYCLVREPLFFRDTQFLIDKFHESGHSKCSSACGSANYSSTDSSLEKVNSSAAECGNSGIARIRKSVSYMRQNRAILYTKVFLSIWNRAKIRRMMQLE
ncbi:hypothetical protein V5O48_008609 [Marasmius crinis-equi]|uniref:HMG domain-containing protein n=1 Tax=Marasmius crinis-equi TaxID=585013 RepID=A0ABR3FDF1_9AGAR